MIITALLNFFSARNSQKTSHQLRLQNTDLDQRILLLQRARDAAIKINEAEAFIYDFVGVKQDPEFNKAHREILSTKTAQISAGNAELRGLGFALDDKILLDLINHRERPKDKFIADSEGIINVAEMYSRGFAQRVHTRIAELTKEAIEKKISNK